MNTTIFTIPHAPSIDGLAFRPFNGEADYAAMAEIAAASSAADGLDYVETADDLRNRYTNLVNCDPLRDMLFVEADGQLIAFGRTSFSNQNDGVRRYMIVADVHPAWRRKGIGRAMQRWLETRVRAIEAGQPAPAPKESIFFAFCEERQSGKQALLTAEGYAPMRYAFEMLRKLNEPIPDNPLPAGFEFRPALPEHYRAIWEADIEAFRDHWGFSPPTEEWYRFWLSNRRFQPNLWKIVWNVADNRIAAQVQNFVDPLENEKFGRLRGYTEDISTQRAYPCMGLARAAICESLRMFRDMGFDETALGVDADNLSGALRVYEACGYRVAHTETLYRKAFA